jgi:hypothetical protein
MTKADANKEREYQQLLDAIFIDEPTLEILRRVDELLKSDDLFRQRYVQAIQLKADLEWDAVALPEHVREADSLSERTVKAIHWRHHPGRFVSLAAALTVAFVTAFFTIVWPRLGEEDIAEGPVEKVPPTVAQLVRVVDAQWASQAPSAGEALQEGRRLRLESGLAQIRFRDGASVILEGPAEFTPLTTNGGRLDFGKLAARIETEQARGFAIRTPAARIVDLGTEFGVVVGRDGVVTTVVVQGKVIVSGSAGRRRLETGESLRITASTVAPLDVGESVDMLATVPRIEAVASVDGAMVLLPDPPPDVTEGALEANDRIVVFRERSRIQLAPDARAGISLTGRHSNGNFRGGAISCDRSVDSYLIHFDPLGDGRDGATVTGSIRFPRPVVGMIASVGLSETDGDYGHPNTIYGAGEFRGLDAVATEPDEFVTLSDDRRTVTVSFRPSASVDQVRVIVTH